MDVLSVPYSYAASLYQRIRHPGLFKEVESFIMFIGYPRSGHTLVGFLLDAHPHIVVASQTKTLKLVKYGFTKQQIFHLLAEDSTRIAKLGREWRTYHYNVPNQWQGRFDTLKVIGDSTGLNRLRRNPALLEPLQRMLNGVGLKLIHCVRNPYDNISTMSVKSKQPLAQAAERYFSMCEIVNEIKNRMEPSAVYDFKYEALIADPVNALEGLCAFLGVNSSDSYYRDCAAILFKSPHKSRTEVEWPPPLVSSVRDKMSGFGFLSDYAYDD